jgi:arabinan endo-1,5-alpha-L-arabinosidase
MFVALTLTGCVKGNKNEKESAKMGFKTDSPIVHDPVLAYENGTYYLFCTGMGVSCMSSKDLKEWTVERSVFEQLPKWISEALPSANLHLWAPDIIFHKGEWHLFYASSAFAKNTSVIGHVTNKTLNPQSDEFEWVDRGMIIQSVPYRDDWNAIDPNIIVDEDGCPWMNFGSFWNGMKMFRMTDDLSAVAQPEEWITLSKRQRTWTLDDKDPGDGAVEAPFIFKKGDWYYLFVSFDYCCRGKESTYKVVVGRSDDVKGPYLDKDGVPMTQGGGSLVIEGDGDKWQAIGHNSAYTFNGKDYFVAHAYEMIHGTPHLVIREISWEDEWPVVNW